MLSNQFLNALGTFRHETIAQMLNARHAIPEGRVEKSRQAETINTRGGLCESKWRRDTTNKDQMTLVENGREGATARFANLKILSQAQS